MIFTAAEITVIVIVRTLTHTKESFDTASPAITTRIAIKICVTAIKSAPLLSDANESIKPTAGSVEITITMHRMSKKRPLKKE